MNVNTYNNLLLDNPEQFLHYCKNTFAVFHNSNVFFRDLQFAVQRFLELKGVKTGVTESEQITKRLCTDLEKQNIFKRINATTWAVQYPAYTTGIPQTYDAV